MMFFVAANLLLCTLAIMVTILMYRFGKNLYDLVQAAWDTERCVGKMVRISKRTHVKSAAISYTIIVLSLGVYFYVFF